MLVLRWSERAHCFFCGRPIGYIRALKGHSALWKRPGDNLVSKAFHDSNFYFSWKLALVIWAKGSSIKTLKGSWPSCLFISELTLVSALQPVNAFPTWNSLHQVKWSFVNSCPWPARLAETENYFRFSRLFNDTVGSTEAVSLFAFWKLQTCLTVHNAG